MTAFCSHKTMSNGSYKPGYCNACRRNVQHFREKKTMLARTFDLATVFVLNFGPWYCAQCEKRSRCLPWIRKREPTIHQIDDDGTERIGNFIRSDGSLVLRKKRSSRYSRKFREGVVQRLLNGKTTLSQLTTELRVTESDLMAWVSEVLQSRDDRIEELTSLLRSYHQAAANLIGISDETIRYDDSENMVEGLYRRRTTDSTSATD